MTCRLCQHEFCWLCFQNYHGHRDALCSKLAREKNEKKKALSETLKNFSQKNKVISEFTRFLDGQKRISDRNLESLRKKGLSEKIEQFEKFQEIEEFFFFTSKISFVFVPNETDQKQLKEEREKVLLKLNQVKNMSSRDNHRLENGFINDNLKKYLMFLELKMKDLRKTHEEFSSLCNI